MSYPPRPPTWEPPSQPPSSHCDPGDLRERVRAVEVWLGQFALTTTERLGAQVRRLELQDERMTGHQARLAEHERRTADIAPLSERVSAIEKKLRHAKERLQYATAAILVGLVAGGRMTVEQIAQIADLLLRRMLGP